MASLRTAVHLTKRRTQPVYAGGNCPSFEQAKDFLLHLAEIDRDVKMVRRATLRVGEERLAQRDLLVRTWDELPLADKGRSPIADVPQLAVVMTDGGRVQILPDGEGDGITEEGTPRNDPTPDDPGAGAGQADCQRRGRFWRENKVAALMRMSGEVHRADPCPDFPEVFSFTVSDLSLFST